MYLPSSISSREATTWSAPSRSPIGSTMSVPDADTMDKLIEDKIAPSDWGKHLGKSASSLVNASTWALMLTGRVYKAAEAVQIGLAQYLVEGSSYDKALELARAAARNLPLTNFAICSAISHLNNMSAMDAAYAEAVVAGVVNTQPEARARLEAFANKTAARVRPGRRHPCPARGRRAARGARAG